MNGANEPTYSEIYRSDAEDAEGDEVPQPDGAIEPGIASCKIHLKQPHQGSTGGLHPYSHLDCFLRQIAVKLLRFSFAVVQLFAAGRRIKRRIISCAQLGSRTYERTRTNQEVYCQPTGAKTQ